MQIPGRALSERSHVLVWVLWRRERRQKWIRDRETETKKERQSFTKTYMEQ
jgi:hypothetical protein